MPQTIAPSPFHLMAKPTGAICNLACDYCYFLSKEALYPGSSFRMSDEVLEAYVRGTLEAQPGPEVTFAWQGGEPTLIGLDFFERAVALQRHYRRPGVRVHNAVQTNGTRLDDAWARFFRRHDFLVGISLDGPRELHDAYRVDKRGGGTFDRVMEGLAVLRRHAVDVNVLTTVHAANAPRPLDVYRFLRDEAGARFVQFIPIVERRDPDGFQRGERLSDRSVGARAYGRFLTAVFDAWVRRDVGRVFVQLFDETLAKHAGERGSLCVFQETCGDALALEHNGDVYACDHYVEPDHLRGNLLRDRLADLVASPAQRAFGRAKRGALPAACRSCEVRWLCHGGCPKDRVARTRDGHPGLNHLCEGYRRFFTHTAPYMRFMANELRNGQPPANVMHAVRASDAQSGTGRRFVGTAARTDADVRRVDGPAIAGGVSRNAPCPCGSGRKRKHCCGS
ncbi:MAG: anaerobic sulfatase maturase [Trueperaceae bacterium]|nr:anaerobic sulfatase maturase [Trueperaceae bacterium]